MTVWHGPWVERKEAFFVEGSWDGPFEDGEFDTTCLLMGSGGRALKNEVRFAVAGHTLERLFTLRLGKCLFVSNSLAFLLERAGTGLDIRYRHYRDDLLAVKGGLDFSEGSIPTRGGSAVRLHHYCTLVVDSSLAVRIRDKDAPPSFRDFAGYHQYLVRGIREHARNACSTARRYRYEMLSCVSSGYDSAAVAALAAEAGCSHAVTYSHGWRLHGKQGIDKDSGEETGRFLGLEVKVQKERIRRRNHERTWPEFSACGDDQDLKLTIFDEELQGKLFFTGYNGDNVWDVHVRPDSRLIRHPPSVGSSIGEFRLRVGFIHVPVPFFAAVRQPEILAISKAEEMQPWSIGGDYDRPIPRRILELKGVPRDLFGMVKKGSIAKVPVAGDLKAYMRRHRGVADMLERAAFVPVRAAVVMGYFADETAAVLFARRRNPIWKQWRNDLSLRARDRFLVQWGVEVLQERYRRAFETSTT